MAFDKVNVILRIIDIPENVRSRINFNALNTTRVVALGSTPELSEWDTQKPVIAAPSPKFDSWEVRVQVSPNSSFDWCFAIYENDLSKKVKTLTCKDPCIRTSHVGKVPCTYVAAWGREGVRRRAETCDVEVGVRFHCHHGQYLVLCGGAPVLGSWDPYHGVEAREEYPPGSGRWTSHLVLDKFQQYQAKWVVVEGPHRRVIRWEELPPHALHVEMGVSRLVLEVEWNGATHVREHNFRLLSDTELMSDSNWLEMTCPSRDQEKCNEELMRERGAVPRRWGNTGKSASERTKPAADVINEPQAVNKDTVAGEVQMIVEKQTVIVDTEVYDDTSPTMNEEIINSVFSPFLWIAEKISEFLDLIE